MMSFSNSDEEYLMKVVAKHFRIAIAAAAVAVAASAVAEESTMDKVERKTGEAVTDVQAAAYDIADKTDLVISFDAKSSALSDAAKRDLEAFVKSLDVSTKTLKLVIAGWSDHLYPVEKSAKLTNADERLATARVKSVASHLKSLRTFDSSETFNMAKRAGIFDRIFQTDDAKIKEELAGERGKDFESSYVASVLKDKGKASTAVVLVYNREKMFSH